MAAAVSESVESTSDNKQVLVNEFVAAWEEQHRKIISELKFNYAKYQSACFAVYQEVPTAWKTFLLNPSAESVSNQTLDVFVILKALERTNVPGASLFAGEAQKLSIDLIEKQVIEYFASLKPLFKRVSQAGVTGEEGEEGSWDVLTEEVGSEERKKLAVQSPYREKFGSLHESLEGSIRALAFTDLGSLPEKGEMAEMAKLTGLEVDVLEKSMRKARDAAEKKVKSLYSLESGAGALDGQMQTSGSFSPSDFITLSNDYPSKAEMETEVSISGLSAVEENPSSIGNQTSSQSGGSPLTLEAFLEVNENDKKEIIVDVRKEEAEGYEGLREGGGGGGEEEEDGGKIIKQMDDENKEEEMSEYEDVEDEFKEDVEKAEKKDMNEAGKELVDVKDKDDINIEKEEETVNEAGKELVDVKNEDDINIEKEEETNVVEVREGEEDARRTGEESGMTVNVGPTVDELTTENEVDEEVNRIVEREGENDQGKAGQLGILEDSVPSEPVSNLAALEEREGEGQEQLDEQRKLVEEETEQALVAADLRGVGISQEENEDGPKMLVMDLTELVEEVQTDGESGDQTAPKAVIGTVNSPNVEPMQELKFAQESPPEGHIQPEAKSEETNLLSDAISSDPSIDLKISSEAKTEEGSGALSLEDFTKDDSNAEPGKISVPPLPKDKDSETAVVEDDRIMTAMIEFEEAIRASHGELEASNVEPGVFLDPGTYDNSGPKSVYDLSFKDLEEARSREQAGLGRNDGKDESTHLPPALPSVEESEDGELLLSLPTARVGFDSIRDEYTPKLGRFSPPSLPVEKASSESVVVVEGEKKESEVEVSEEVAEMEGKMEKEKEDEKMEEEQKVEDKEEEKVGEKEKEEEKEEMEAERRATEPEKEKETKEREAEKGQTEGETVIKEEKPVVEVAKEEDASFPEAPRSISLKAPVIATKPSPTAVKVAENSSNGNVRAPTEKNKPKRSFFACCFQPSADD